MEEELGGLLIEPAPVPEGTPGSWWVSSMFIQHWMFLEESVEKWTRMSIFLFFDKICGLTKNIIDHVIVYW